MPEEVTTQIVTTHLQRCTGIRFSIQGIGNWESALITSRSDACSTSESVLFLKGISLLDSQYFASFGVPFSHCIAQRYLIISIIDYSSNYVASDI